MFFFHALSDFLNDQNNSFLEKQVEKNYEMMGLILAYLNLTKIKCSYAHGHYIRINFLEGDGL